MSGGKPALTSAVILCGGRGTRLFPETERQPKAMLPVGDRPIVEHIIGHFMRYGIRRFVLCLGYRAAAFREHFTARAEVPGTASQHAVTVEVGTERGRCTVVLLDTGLDTATGGRVKRAEVHVTGERFMVAYGDVLSDVDLDDLRAFHDEQGRLATVTAVQPNSPFGHLVIDDDNRVRGFQEKPRLAAWVNIGFAVLERQIFQRLTDDSPQLEAGLFPEMAAGDQLSAFRHFGSFEPMDSYADYRRLNKMQDAGELEWIDRNRERPR